jgi:hypothetical protein
MLFMEIDRDHRRVAAACVAIARAANDDTDKALWLMLAQSWVRLAEHIAGSAAGECRAEEEDVPALQAPEGGVSFETA